APGCAPALHYHLDWTAHAYEHHRQAHQLPGASRKNLQRPGIAVVVSYIDRHIQTQPAMRSNRFVHGAVEILDKRLKVGSLTAGTQADAELISLGCHLLETVDAQVQPHALEP